MLHDIINFCTYVCKTFKILAHANNQTQIKIDQIIVILRLQQFHQESMSLKTNILRIKTEGPAYHYKCHFSSTIGDQDALQIQFHIQSLDNNIVYAHPYLYSNNKLNATQLQVLLSRGQTISIKIQQLSQVPKISMLQYICQKLLRGLQFMEYRKIKTYFNPFQEKNNTIPGLYLEPVYEQSYTGIAFLPVNLILQPPVEISSSKILLNYTNGRFYEKSDIVRVDKQKNLIHFRNGQNVLISSLRKGRIKDVNGLVLAQRLRNYSERIRQNSKQFLQNWGILLQGHFYNTNGSLISVGGISLRQNKEKPLSDIVAPMARNSYNNNFRQLFKIPFQSQFQAQLMFLIPAQISKQGKQIIHELQKQSQKMNLKIKTSHVTISSLEDRREIEKVLASACYNKAAIYVLVYNKQTINGGEQENVHFFKQEMIKNQLYFHIVNFDNEEEEGQMDIVATRTLAVLYCKMRRIPWKIKNIPFADKPTVAAVVNVQQTSDGRYSVAIVSTMNAFFSKFCCHILACEVDRIEQTIFNLLQQSLNKFCLAHKIYPFRIFLYRTGLNIDPEHQNQSLVQKVRNFYSSLNIQNPAKLTYVQLRQSHPLRFYLQTDQNIISRLTVKKTQLLTYTVVGGKHYVQLQFQQAPTQIRIFDYENDPTFAPKVLEFTAKLCFGSVGNQFGKGTGFLSFANKLNQYRDFNLHRWQQFLQQGVMLFL